MALKHIQLLRKAGFTSFEGAKTAILTKLSETMPGEPLVSYYKDGAESATSHVIFGIGGTSGQSMFYNAEVTDSLLSKLQSAISGETSDSLDAKLTLQALKNKIEGLDFTEIGSSTAGSRKIINTIKETDGLISATTIDLTASNIDATAIESSDSTVAVTGTTVANQIASLGKSIKSLDNAKLTYKTVAITGDALTALGANVLEAYKVVSVTTGGTETQVGDTIKIYKDQRLASMSYSGQILTYTYEDASGNTQTVNIDLSELIQEAEVENGIQSIDHKLSIKLDSSSENFLSVGTDGIKLSGVSEAISEAVEVLDSTVSAKTAGVSARVVETDGKLTSISIGVEHPTVTWTNSATHSVDVLNPERVLIGSDIEGVETYVKDYINATAIYSSGDTYISAVVDSGNASNNANKKLVVSARTASVSATTGTIGVWEVSDAGVATKTIYVAPTLVGVSGKLMDGADAMSNVKTYVDTKCANEQAEYIARIAAALKSLDSTASSEVTSDNNVNVNLTLTDGKISELSARIDTLDCGEWS